LDGSGTEAAVPSPYIERVGTDIYGARHVAIIDGGHHLPFADVPSTACGFNAVYFLGRRAEKPLAAHEMIAYYPGPR
jgi:hypothetical protein